ncbi:FMN-binding negative transcriptional regulator [Polyangium aurulentum]|uniref:FMN-binding negative transcriptional regulator n=1 Tax=Polyangium aurulentum TaxID=2567896 RepID=UPI0010AE8B30|nr:FMN-binding negative transcriptional regulator [Polyangium aurulentum]UQA61186.1 FMN-binding negative transcriptional regulator [Polyangium aurulentum]
MYLPKVFREDDRDRLHDLVAAHDFGTLIVPHEDGVEISHVPFVLDREGGLLRTHVARTNSIWQKAIAAQSVVAVFQGPHGYVSARWYEKPERQVPTWNYAVVHAHGRAQGPMPRDELRALLDDLVAIHERGAPSPWSTAELAPEFLDGLMEGIVGLSIRIERLEGKFKLSQNRSPEDQQRVMRALAERGTEDDRAMLALMSNIPRQR